VALKGLRVIGYLVWPFVISRSSRIPIETQTDPENRSGQGDAGAVFVVFLAFQKEFPFARIGSKQGKGQLKGIAAHFEVIDIIAGCSGTGTTTAVTLGHEEPPE
jgi:hypothetical protein